MIQLFFVIIALCLQYHKQPRIMTQHNQPNNVFTETTQPFLCVLETVEHTICLLVAGNMYQRERTCWEKRFWITGAEDGSSAILRMKAAVKTQRRRRK